MGDVVRRHSVQRTSTTLHWNRHSVVTGEQHVYIDLYFPALRRSWFPRLNFHF